MKNSTQYTFFRRLISIIAWGIGIFIALILIVIGISPYIPKHWPSESAAELDRIRKELPLAEARWKAHGITEYEVDALGIVHPGGCFDITKDPAGSFTPWHLQIRQGEIVFDSDIQKKNIEGCDMGDFLPPKVFDTIRQKLKEVNSQLEYLEIEFDPVYGFVSDYALTSNSSLSDLFIHYVISNFRPKQP